MQPQRLCHGINSQLASDRESTLRDFTQQGFAFCRQLASYWRLTKLKNLPQLLFGKMAGISRRNQSDEIDCLLFVPQNGLEIRWQARRHFRIRADGLNVKGQRSTHGFVSDFVDVLGGRNLLDQRQLLRIDRRPGGRRTRAG